MTRTAAIIFLLLALFAVGFVVRHASGKTDHRLVELQRRCDELREQLQARDQTIAELQTQFASARVVPTLSSTATGEISPSVTEADLQRRMAEVTALQAKAAELIQAMKPTREADMPEQAERARVYVQVYEKHLQQAQQKASEMASRSKELLISMNIPRDIASMDAGKGLAAVDLQAYWLTSKRRKKPSRRA
jgi:hypothetical protein